MPFGYLRRIIVGHRSHRGLTTRKQRVTICEPLGIRPLQDGCVEAQGALIDVTSNHNREVDDLDCMLRDALRCTDDPAPDSARVFAAVRARVSADAPGARRSWSIGTPAEAYAPLSAAYWYVVPLARMMR